MINTIQSRVLYCVVSGRACTGSWLSLTLTTDRVASPRGVGVEGCRHVMTQTFSTSASVSSFYTTLTSLRWWGRAIVWRMWASCRTMQRRRTRWVGCLSRHLHFFQNRSYWNFLGSYLQREELSINDENCAIRHVNGFKACVLHAQNIKNKNIVPS